MIAFLQILLKIFGIILLSLIGLVIVLLLVVLLVPVRYRVKGYYKEEFVCHGKVTWLLHLVSVSIDYEKELITNIKILGIPLSVFTRKRDKKKASSKQDEKELPAVAVDKTDNTKKTAVDSKNSGTESINTDKPDTSDTESSLIEITKENSQEDENIETNKKLSWFQKIKSAVLNFIQKVRDIFDKICNIISNIRQKKETLEHYIEIINRNEVKQAFALCKRRIKLLFKHILPKKMYIKADFGFDDPSTTGYILAIYGMLPASLGKKIILNPDFDNALFKCDFSFKGYVNAWSILHQLLCILTDKNCRALYDIVKKEILNERK